MPGLLPLAHPHDLPACFRRTVAPSPSTNRSIANLQPQASQWRRQAPRASASPSSSTLEAPVSLADAPVSSSSNWAEKLLRAGRAPRVREVKPEDGPATGSNVFSPAVPRTQRRTRPGGSAYGPNGADGTDDDEDDDDEAGASGVPEKRLPAAVRCFDTARIYVKGGDGGNGCVAFRREAGVARGGPAGGSGGRGGHVWAVVAPELNSLFSFRRTVHWRALPGVNGQGSQCIGADGVDTLVPVPPGTILRRKGAGPDEPPLAELMNPGDRALLVTGGRGGRGNESFKSSRNKAPTLAERGETGIESWVDLELRVVADAGIIGIPNAGKSTLLSVISAARPKIANYPFTTLVPNLGVCEMDYRTTVFADVPGLLEGAHEGVGLGHEFLRHLQRCRTLVHVLDGTSADPVGDFRAICLELELFQPALMDKPQIIAYNKVDDPESGDYWELTREALIADGHPADRLYAVSAVTGQGVLELVRGVRALLDELGPQKLELETDALNLQVVPRRVMPKLDDFTVTVEVAPGAPGGRIFVVNGAGLERFTTMTNWNYYEAVRRFERVLQVSGVNAALAAKGVKDGDSVAIGGAEFTWGGDKRETALYGAWLEDMKARGIGRQGTHAWPQVDFSARKETKV